MQILGIDFVFLVQSSDFLINTKSESTNCALANLILYFQLLIHLLLSRQCQEQKQGCFMLSNFA
jgi:hypothetical protein